jgi:hypothetical protein
MKTLCLSLAIVANLTAVLSPGSFFAVSAFAGSVTATELSGKKICWDDGLVATFLPDGKYHSNKSGEGTWRVTSVGVQLHTEHYSGLYDIDKQPDGTFKSLTRHANAHYCN